MRADDLGIIASRRQRHGPLNRRRSLRGWYSDRRKPWALLTMAIRYPQWIVALVRPEAVWFGDGDLLRVTNQPLQRERQLTGRPGPDTWLIYERATPTTPPRRSTSRNGPSMSTPVTPNILGRGCLLPRTLRATAGHRKPVYQNVVCYRPSWLHAREELGRWRYCLISARKWLVESSSLSEVQARCDDHVSSKGRMMSSACKATATLRCKLIMTHLKSGAAAMNESRAKHS